MNKWLDKVLLLVAIVIAVAAAYYATSNSNQSSVRQTGARGSEFAAELPSIATPDPVRWEEPAVQQDNWIFEVFTPPRVFFNQATERFLVELPRGEVAEPPPTAFGLEVVGIRRDPFRVQLTGYSGPIGYFRIADQNERGRAKQVFDEVRIEVVSVTEERIVEADPEDPKRTPRIRRQGVAIIKDLEDGKEYRLISGETALYDYPIVDVQLRLADSREVQTEQLKVGETWEVNGAKYTLLSVDEGSKNAVVKKELLDGSAPEDVQTLQVQERIILTPAIYQEYQEGPLPMPLLPQGMDVPRYQQESGEIEGTLSRPPPPGQGMNVSTETFFE